MNTKYNVGDYVKITSNENSLKKIGILNSDVKGSIGVITHKNKINYIIKINKNKDSKEIIDLASNNCYNYYIYDEQIEHKVKIIKIKYHCSNLIPLKRIEGEKSDWIDLRAAEHVILKAGELRKISLGVSMHLPPNYEAHILPRSSTPEKFGIIMAHSQGIIDNSYCGDNDIWMFQALAIRDTTIQFNDRIAQFRIMKKQPCTTFVPVCNLGNPDRGGFGSTGIR